MKTILVPIDFSGVAENALDYAANLAKLTDSKLILFHSYHVPLAVSEVPIVIISDAELEKENMDALKVIDKKIKKSNSNLKTELIVKAGFLVEEICSIIDEKKVDLVVMGVTGAANAFNMLLGSNTTSVIKRIKTPVLVIPKDARFKEIEKIVFAYDYSETVPQEIIVKLKEFTKLFNARILILNIEENEKIPDLNKAVSGVRTENLLKDVRHMFYFRTSENVIEETNSFVDAHKADLLVMVPHQNNLLKEIFHRSNTKKMAFHTHIPLLSLHD